MNVARPSGQIGLIVCKSTVPRDINGRRTGSARADERHEVKAGPPPTTAVGIAKFIGSSALSAAHRVPKPPPFPFPSKQQRVPHMLPLTKVGLSGVRKNACWAGARSIRRYASALIRWRSLSQVAYNTKSFPSQPEFRFMHTSAATTIRGVRDNCNPSATALALACLQMRWSTRPV